MICKNCGNSCADDALFCSQCGKCLDSDTAKLQILPDLPGLECEHTPAEIEAADSEGSAMETAAESDASEISVEDKEDAPEIPASGGAVPVEYSQTELRPSAPVAQNRQRRKAIWAPVLVMLGICLIGFCGFLFLHTGSGTVGLTPTEEIPWLSMDENGMVTFLDYAYSGNGNITIPDTIDGRTVYGLSNGAFAGSDIVTVHLPSSIRFIEDSAFRNCESLRGIFLPAGITQIGANAFYSCKSLEAICVPGTVQSIGDGCFEDCSNLRFLFYSGYYIGWKSLYNSEINPFLSIICVDGTYNSEFFG